MFPPSPGRLCWLLLALTTTLSAVALAAPDDKAALSKARAKFMQATELEQAGDYAAALLAFREVAEVRMTPQVRFHIATCEEKLGKLVVALGGYELALGEAESLGPDFKQEVEARADALRARIPKLVIERGEGAQAAAIELDGVALGASSIGVEVPLDPGPHAIFAKAPGYKPFSSTFEIPEREVKNVTIALESATAKDDAAAASTMPANPEETPKQSRLVPYLIGGVGVAALAGAGVFYLLQKSTDDELFKLCDNDFDCDDGEPITPAERTRSQSLNKKLRTYSTLVQVSLVTGVVAIGTATVLILTEPKPTPAKTAWFFAPQAPGADVGGLSLGRQF